MTVSSPAGTIPAPNPFIETAFLPPEAVLFDDHSGAVFKLNASASAVWMLIDGEQTAADIARDLSDIVGLPAEQLLPDVVAAAADFADRGLLAIDEPEPTSPLEPIVLARPPDP